MSNKSLLIGMVRFILAGDGWWEVGGGKQPKKPPPPTSYLHHLKLESCLQFEPAIVAVLGEGSEAAP